MLTAASERCAVAPLFTNIPASLKVPLNLQRDEYLRRVQLANDPVRRRPTWMSGQGQDWWVWFNHARFGQRSTGTGTYTGGTYVDLAANDAIWRSSTYFFDVCLGWKGLLVEPNPTHHARIRQERGGTLVPSCISNITDRDVTFREGLGWRGGSSKIDLACGQVGKPACHLGGAQPRPVRCRALGAVLNEAHIRHVDFLSLDVEGHEMEVLSSIDLNAVKVDIIISENPAVHAMLRGSGYRRVSTMHDHVFLRKGFVLNINRARANHRTNRTGGAAPRQNGRRGHATPKGCVVRGDLAYGQVK